MRRDDLAPPARCNNIRLIDLLAYVSQPVPTLGTVHFAGVVEFAAAKRY